MGPTELDVKTTRSTQAIHDESSSRRVCSVDRMAREGPGSSSRSFGRLRLGHNGRSLPGDSEGLHPAVFGRDSRKGKLVRSYSGRPKLREGAVYDLGGRPWKCVLVNFSRARIVPEWKEQREVPDPEAEDGIKRFMARPSKGLDVSPLATLPEWKGERS